MFKLDESYRLSKVFIYTLEFHTSSYIHIIYFALFRQSIYLLIYYFISIIFHIPENILFHIFPWSFLNFRFTFTWYLMRRKIIYLFEYRYSNFSSPLLLIDLSLNLTKFFLIKTVDQRCVRQNIDQCQRWIKRRCKYDLNTISFKYGEKSIKLPDLFLGRFPNQQFGFIYRSWCQRVSSTSSSNFS